MSKWRLKLLQRLTILMWSSTNGSAERSNNELTEKCKNDSTKRFKNGLRRRENLLQSPKWLDLPKRKGFATFLEIRFFGMTAITKLVAAITIGVSFGVIRSNSSSGTSAIKGSKQSPTATPAKRATPMPTAKLTALSLLRGYVRMKIEFDSIYNLGNLRCVINGNSLMGSNLLAAKCLFKFFLVAWSWLSELYLLPISCPSTRLWLFLQWRHPLRSIVTAFCFDL